MSDDVLEQLNRAFGSKSGGTPSFSAEAEGDDYLFGPLPQQPNEQEQSNG